MQKFGSTNNIFGQIGERVLKSMVKDHDKKTQQQVNFCTLPYTRWNAYFKNRLSN